MFVLHFCDVKESAKKYYYLINNIERKRSVLGKITFHLSYADIDLSTCRMLLIGQTCRLASSFFHCCHYGLYTGMNSGLFSLLHTCCGHYGYLNTQQFLGEYNLIFRSTNYILRLFLTYPIACHLTTKTYHYLTTINFICIIFYFSFKLIIFCH